MCYDSDMISKTCETCSAIFTVKPYRAARARFCSFKCGGEWHARTRLAALPRTWLEGNQHRAGKRPANAFATGHVPWNSGMKGIHLSPATEWKRGQTSLRKMPVGAVVIRRRTREDESRAFVKVADPNVWLARAQFVWMQANGGIPAGHVIHHIDRNPLNDAIENLSLETRASHLLEHRDEFRK